MTSSETDCVWKLSLERLNDLVDSQNRLCRLDTYISCDEGYTNDPTGLGSLMYGDLEDVKLNNSQLSEWLDEGYLLLMPDAMSGSDYSGGTCNRSNYLQFLQDHADDEWVHDVFGGGGTYAVAIEVSSMTEEVFDTLRGLADYAVYDEGAHSRLESELEDKAWSDCGESDFLDLVKKLFSFKEVELLCELAGPEGDQKEFAVKFRDLFDQACEDADEYVTFEVGCIAYWDMKYIVECVSFDEFIECCDFWEHQSGATSEHVAQFIALASDNDFVCSEEKALAVLAAAWEILPANPTDAELQKFMSDCLFREFYCNQLSLEIF